MPYTYQYPHPAVTVDIIIFALHDNDLKVLLIQRKAEPFRECWAIPGGFVEIDEDLETAARRELWEETGVKDVFLEQLYTFGAPHRDPRERVISVAYYSLVRLSQHTIRAASDALNACWYPIHHLPTLAFDHQRIMDMAITRLQGKVLYVPIIFELLPTQFRLDELQKVFEIILERPFDSRSFNKKILATEILTQVAAPVDDNSKPSQRLFQFDEAKYQRMQEEGFQFEIKPGSPKK